MHDGTAAAASGGGVAAAAVTDAAATDAAVAVAVAAATGGGGKRLGLHKAVPFCCFDRYALPRVEEPGSSPPKRTAASLC